MPCQMTVPGWLDGCWNYKSSYMDPACGQNQHFRNHSHRPSRSSAAPRSQAHHSLKEVFPDIPPIRTRSPSPAPDTPKLPVVQPEVPESSNPRPPRLIPAARSKTVAALPRPEAAANLLDEAADLRKPRFSIDHALSRRRQRQFFLRTGDSDIAETPFFFNGVLIIRKMGMLLGNSPSSMPLK